MVIMHSVLALFAAIRTYAIYDQSRVVFFCVLGLGLLFPFGDIYRLARQNYRPFPSPVPGCSTFSTLPDGLTPRMGSDQLLCLLGLGTNILFEFIVVTLTWMRTFPAVRQMEDLCMNSGKNLTYVVFRNGTFNFLAILVINLSGLPLFISMIATGRVDRDSQTPDFQVSDKGIVTSLIEAITSILLSRFILDLRRDYVTRSEHDQDHSLHIQDISAPSSLHHVSQELSRFRGSAQVRDWHQACSGV
ncbi:hypothetical protein BC629DRAFT_910515 [Irpex lacteus]|nr:hypothetical protein BC629DRAFT_910515 [Irpex lacteus]